MITGDVETISVLATGGAWHDDQRDCVSGSGPYCESAYVHDGEAYVTCLFPLALAQFCELKPDQWQACVTDEAAETHYYRSLEAELQVQAVRIPWGKDSEELWQIFDRVVEAINPREQVVFDITHGFLSCDCPAGRSLPQARQGD